MIWHFRAADFSYKRKGCQSYHGADGKEKSYYKALFKLTCSSDCSDLFILLFPTPLQFFFHHHGHVWEFSHKIPKRQVLDDLTSTEFSLHEIWLDKLKTGGTRLRRKGLPSGLPILAPCQWKTFGALATRRHCQSNDSPSHQPEVQPVPPSYL